MNREQKSAAIEEIADQIKQANAVFAVDYRGISVTQAAELRARLREADARFRVVKNSLTERAADRAGAEALKEMLEGPTALTFVLGDPAPAAKAIADYGRTTDLLPFKGGILEGDRLEPDQIRAIARLPARDVLYGQLVGVVAHPVSGLVRTLNALIQGLALQLGQIAEQGLVTGEAPAEAADEPPAEPEGEAPAEPGGEPPAEVPAEPDGKPPAEAPAEPEGEPPAEAPAEPEGEAPADPADEVPAAPASEGEAEPQETQESEPESTPATDDTDADAPSSSGVGSEEKE